VNLALADFDIPEMFRVTPEEAERRRLEWEANPPKPLSMLLGNISDADQEKRAADRQRFIDEQEARKKRALDNLSARKSMEREDAKKGITTFTRKMPGTVWDARRGRWVDPHQPMDKMRYERLMREMPTQRHRELLAEMYGGGRCLPTQTTSTAKSSTKKVATAAPSTRSRPTPTAPATARKRVPKEEQVAHVRAMLARPEGATLAEAGATFGWLEHSTSAFISVHFRNAGLKTTKEKVEGRGTVYRFCT
jgi:hypothetical protein